MLASRTLETQRLVRAIILVFFCFTLFLRAVCMTITQHTHIYLTIYFPCFFFTTGIYSEATMKSLGLPSPMAAFDRFYLMQNPKPFYHLCRQIFLPVIKNKIKYVVLLQSLLVFAVVTVVVVIFCGWYVS